MYYCRKCLTPDTRPNGKFNQGGVCIPCEFSSKSTGVSYEERLGQLDIEDIKYPENVNLDRLGVRGIYLSNYIPWDSRRFSEEMIAKFSALASKNKRTFDTYDRIDDVTYMTIHDVIKQAKLGYSRVTDNLCREIRFKRISKEDARSVESFYQAEYPRVEIEHFLRWLGMDYQGFQWYLDHLPFAVNEAPVDTSELTSDQRAFIDSFEVNCVAVHENSEYIV